MEKKGFEALPEVRFIERDGKDYPAFLIPVDEFDMQRPGVYSSGEYFEGNGVAPSEVSKAGKPHKIVSRAMEVVCGAGGLQAGEGAAKKVLFCADLAINFGNDKSGTKWIIKRNVLDLRDTAKGAVIPNTCGWLDLEAFEQYKAAEEQQERVRRERLARLTNPEEFIQKPEFQRKGKAAVAEA